VLTGRPSALRVAASVLATSTSFFLLSNFMVWTGSHMYAHTAAGLGACYVAAIPFYANDAMSTAITAAAFFGLPALARNISTTMQEAYGRRAA
jgi:Ni,Fe-hydrogenase I cytochrome b subunit